MMPRLVLDAVEQTIRDREADRAVNVVVSRLDCWTARHPDGR
jgi:hypothetical protein